MNNSLIGYTGFVGGNLFAQKHFDKCYNSKNIHEIRGKAFSEIVCAGIQAVKWKANQDPEWDRKKIKELENELKTVDASRFVLISTIDVYPVLTEKDESYDCHEKSNHSYGEHRLEFEDFCRQKFGDVFIVRLPALFGSGLKKNVIYDLIHGNCLESINPESAFQYYCLDNLCRDIEIAVKNDIHTVNLFSEPVATREIVDRLFPQSPIGSEPAPRIVYDLRTKYSSLWNCPGTGYVCDKNTVLEQISAFLKTVRFKQNIQNK